MEENIFKNGIRFQCQGSSKCCVSRGSYGYVYLSMKDLQKISKYFKISMCIFKKKYCDTTNGLLHFKETKKNGNCQFLKKNKCSIYEARPTQCRTWPFWKENINPKKWNKEIINFCPGIGKGEIINFSKIKKIVNQDVINDNIIINESKNKV